MSADLDAEGFLEEEPDRSDNSINETLTVNEYLNEVLEDPNIERSSKQRLADMLEYFGVAYNEDKERNEYDIFTEDHLHDGKNAIYGDNALGKGGPEGFGIDRLGDFIVEAANQMGAHKRVTVQIGPVGSSKTATTTLLQSYYSHYTKTEAGRMETFLLKNLYSDENDEPHERVPGQHPDHDEMIAPMWQSPILLFDNDPAKVEGTPKREKLISTLEEGSYWDFDHLRRQDLVPESQFYKDHLIRSYLESGEAEDEYEAFQKFLDNHIEVTRLIADGGKNRAIATIQPKEPKNQKARDIVGGTEMSLRGVYGKNDPRSFDYGGILNKANRGIANFLELLKLDTEHRYPLLEASENQIIQPEGRPEMDVDLWIVGSSNMPEFKKQVDEETEEAFNSRTNRVDRPYLLEYDDEAKIYEKFRKNSNYDEPVEPHTFEMAAMFAVATRLEEPKDIVSDVLEKVRAYNGDLDMDEEDVKQLRDQGEEDSEHGEGMKGLTTRYPEDQIANALQDVHKSGRETLTPMRMLEFLENNLEENASIQRDDHEHLRDLISRVREEEYRVRATEDVMDAAIYKEDELEKEADKYMEMAADFNDGNRDAVDERFMRSIEEEIGITEDNKENFRGEVGKWAGKRFVEGREFNSLENERVREGVRKKSFDRIQDKINLSNLVTDGESIDGERKNEIIENMVDMGYTRPGAKKVLEYVGVAYSSEDEIKDALGTS